MLSQLLTLYATPAIHLYRDRPQQWLPPRRRVRMGALAAAMGTGVTGRAGSGAAGGTQGSRASRTNPLAAARPLGDNRRPTEATAPPPAWAGA